jgi:hypothetical protein
MAPRIGGRTHDLALAAAIRPACREEVTARADRPRIWRYFCVVQRFAQPLARLVRIDTHRCGICGAGARRARRQETDER